VVCAIVRRIRLARICDGADEIELVIRPSDCASERRIVGGDSLIAFTLYGGTRTWGFAFHVAKSFCKFDPRNRPHARLTPLSDVKR